MSVILDRPEARSLPSRHRFALARLLAFAQLRLRFDPRAQKPEHLVLSIDRDQSAAEAHTVAAWIYVTTACYLATLLPFSQTVSLITAIPLASLAIHIPIVGGGLLFRWLAGDGSHEHGISVSSMAILLLWSLHVARTTTWIRFVAVFFVAVVIINTLAALLLWCLRNQVRAAEERCVR